MPSWQTWVVVNKYGCCLNQATPNFKEFLCRVYGSWDISHRSGERKLDLSMANIIGATIDNS